jgi:hypothetical protein
MERRWRLRLPTVFGLISLQLLLWDAYYQEWIFAQGMAFDTGVPLWPFETPRMVVQALNFPAALVAYRLARAAGFEHYWMQHTVLLGLLLVWWWWLGTRLDFGLVRPGRIVIPRTLTLLVSILALVSAAMGIYGLSDAISWWNLYGSFAPDPLIRLGFGIVGTVWFFALAALGACAVWHIRSAGR